MTITIQYLYYLVGVVLAVTAVMTLRDASNPRRFSAGLFWALYALVFLVGDLLPSVWATNCLCLLWLSPSSPWSVRCRPSIWCSVVFP